MSIEATDRYDVTGPHNGCDGDCEGTGFVPIFMAKGDHGPGLIRVQDETDPTYIALWEEAEKKQPTQDGYHFVRCPKCGDR